LTPAHLPEHGGIQKAEKLPIVVHLNPPAFHAKAPTQKTREGVFEQWAGNVSRAVNASMRAVCGQ
jgi:hypothetical protein